MARSKVGRKKPWLASKHPARNLARLLGSWRVDVTLPGAAGSIRGTATFRWLAKDALMVVRTHVRGFARGGLPTSVAVLGADDVNETYSMLYADERGVTRQYAMQLSRTTWQMERRAPRFSQRFVGTFSRDGRVIRGEWQISPDGRRWKHDLAIVYSKRH